MPTRTTGSSRLHLLVLVVFCAISSAIAGGVDPLDHAVLSAPPSDEERPSKRCLFGVCLGRRSHASRPTGVLRRDLVPSNTKAESDSVDPLLKAMNGRRGDKAAAWYARTLDARQPRRDMGDTETADTCAFSYECVAVDHAVRVACVQGECKVLACREGFDLDKTGTVCLEARPNALTVQSYAQRYGMHGKRAAIELPTSGRLCPGAQYEACPIASNKMLRSQGKHREDDEEDVVGMLVSGGYECVDTSNSLTSCGGCATNGAGRDCTAIRHAEGVSCREATCIVYSCRRGWRPSASGSHCLRGAEDREIPRAFKPGHASRPGRAT